jgi:hypothetical protein
MPPPAGFAHADGPEHAPLERHGDEQGTPGSHPSPPQPLQQTMHTALELERLYREQGRNHDVVVLYQDILGKTKDPGLRDFAYRQLAHAQLEPADTSKAIATLTQSLNESLERVNSMPPPRENQRAEP